MGSTKSTFTRSPPPLTNRSRRRVAEWFWICTSARPQPPATSANTSITQKRAPRTCAAPRPRRTGGMWALRLRAAGELARLRVDLHLLAFLDEQRHADLEPGL